MKKIGGVEWSRAPSESGESGGNECGPGNSRPVSEEAVAGRASSARACRQAGGHRYGARGTAADRRAVREEGANTAAGLSLSTGARHQLLHRPPAIGPASARLKQVHARSASSGYIYILLYPLTDSSQKHNTSTSIFPVFFTTSLIFLISTFFLCEVTRYSMQIFQRRHFERKFKIFKYIFKILILLFCRFFFSAKPYLNVNKNDRNLVFLKWCRSCDMAWIFNTQSATKIAPPHTLNER